MILNTWHFHHALALVFKVVCRGCGVGRRSPLNTELYASVYI
ncbi:hypothetical protein VCRA2121O391_10488 [Vibrio crassostreae]|nr:hypothetical protein VCRA2117O378_10488 [Vibrio crassostreae]CAK1980215.1 hypothetical protein VCRA2114O369_20002 [Vibrio crassostreae]CAK1982791.1 hypothetical protein VCRA2113O199_20002 [Vibrio crassostreae]CAK1983664.1 hypothetical protein VCRA2113O354_20002 [Vibrio crassostreae]CAK2036515.1 hypothetical protein VCRA2113O362_20511 [Vibrio crassostreae]